VLKDWGKLVLSQGERQSLIVEADEEFLDKVETVVSDGTITLRVGRSWLDMMSSAVKTNLAHQKVIYHITVESIESIEVTGAARVESETLRGETLHLRFGGAGDIRLAGLSFDLVDVEMPGAGRLELSGTAREQRVLLSGAGSYSAAGLECARAVVELRGVGKARVDVRDRLEAIVRGLGAIEYSGDPEVEKTITGLGQVTKV
jgi:hypothetical protein